MIVPPKVIITLLLEEEQGELEMVQLKVLLPVPSPVIVDVGFEGAVIVPAPLTKLHNPVPTEGIFPAMVAVVAQAV